MPNGVNPEEPLEPPTIRGTLVDRRELPKGVLPRQLQTWLMVGIALVILLIIYLTGHPEPPPATRSGEASAATPSSLPPDRVRTYQQRLAEQEARLRQELADTARNEQRMPAVVGDDQAQADPLVEERRRRDYQSLFADNVALSRRPANQHPSGASAGDVPIGWYPPPPTAPVQSGVSEAAQGASERASAGTPKAFGVLGPIPSTGPLHRLLEGTVVDTVLINRLDGAFSGSVNCLVTTPVYSHSRQHLVIPAGARVLGTASPVQAWGESRLAVRFHRLVMPDGRSYSLEKFVGLNQAGDVGLKDQVNRHYMQVFGASLAIGALSGLAQFQTRGGADPAYEFSDAYRQGLGGSLATSAGRILDRFLNALPTITIREGHRVKVYLTSDLELPEYR